MRHWWTLIAGAVCAAALCLVMGHASRLALNPDGVSYLDLATLLHSGGVAAAIQSYWSPLYPALLAGLRSFAPDPTVGWLRLVHAMDTGLVLLTIAVLVRTAWQLRRPTFGLAVIPLYLLAAGRLPRVEAVTPDILLGFLLALLGSEILLHGTRRWGWLGLLAGTIYLAKTSSWLWLLVVGLGGLLVVGSPTGRRQVAAASAVALGIMLLWVVPMSLASGQFTLGSTGRLNYQWYLGQSDSRTPDTHTGGHQLYRTIQLADQLSTTIAVFQPGPWTYQPWGDPTAWDRGIADGSTRPTVASLRDRILGDLKPMFRVWLLSVLVGVLLPLALVTLRPGSMRPVFRQDPRGLFLMAAGAAAVAQFLVVHAEPRLIAPFVLLGGMGAVHMLTRVLDEAADRPRWTWWAALAPGWCWALLLGVVFVHREQVQHQLREGILQENRRAVARYVHDDHGGRLRVAILGSAGTAMDDVWLLGGQVVAQVVQPRAAVLDRWSPEDRVAVLQALRGFQPDVVWIPTPDGDLSMMPGR